MTALVATSPSPTVMARRAIARHSKSFALASRLLSPRVRDHTSVVYAYCRMVDDAIDERPGDDPTRTIASLISELAAVYRLPAARQRSAPLDDIVAAFGAIVDERAIPPCYPHELIAGMAMDATDTRYATLSQLHRYCYRVAGTVGLMMCHVFGVRDDDALIAAARLGIAMQLTNICRDVAEDWQRGRLYVPDDILTRHGAGGLAPLAGSLARPLPPTAIAPLAAAVRELLEVADEHYRAADRGIPALPWRAGLAVRAARAIYRAIGDQIAARGYDVTAGRAVVPRRTKLALVAGATARAVVAAPRAIASPAARIPTRVIDISEVADG